MKVFNRSALQLPLVGILPAFLLGLALGQSAPDRGLGSDDGSAAPATLFRRGVEALQSGQLAIAEDDFRGVIALDPGSGAAHINLGVAYMRGKRWDNALAELHKARPLSPDEPGIDLNIGLVYYRKNDFASAIAPLAAALQRDPALTRARYLLGLCYFFRNNYQEAIHTLAPLWELESGNLNYLYVLSIAAGKSSNPELEKRGFDQMLAIGKSTPEFHLYIGKAWLAKNDTGKALEEFNAAAEARPDLPMVHYFLGRTYLERHAYSQAQKELENDLTIDPDFAYDYEDLGILFVQLHQPEQAERFYLQAIAHDTTLVNSYFGMAKLYRDAGRYREALQMLNRATTLAPQSASVHYTRGQVLRRLGQSADARQEFETSARLLKSFNDQIQQDPSGDQSADAQGAAQ